MNGYSYVKSQIAAMKQGDKPLQCIAWDVAVMCAGWAYVYGARGESCTPSNRRSRYRSGHPTIQTACKNYNGDKTCSGCKWYPGGNRTLFFDCRGFTYWVLKQVYDWKLVGVGCTSQWNNPDNWAAKGKISDGFPKDTLVCLFYSKDGKEKTWEHTGFGFNNETVECSSGVQYCKTRNKKWTHWAIPKCVEGEVVIMPKSNPTVKRGSKGEYVKELQKGLQKLGYDLGSCGVDGDFGKATEAAVMAFQMDYGLDADGVCGPVTWSTLNNTPSDPSPKPVITLYNVHIPCVSEDVANALLKEYPGSWKTTE